MAKQVKKPKSERPVHTLRHRSIEAAIWRNQTEKGPFYKVTIVRSYKKDDAWHDTPSFGYDDLMNVAKLMYDAHSWISGAIAQEAAERKPAAPSMAH